MHTATSIARRALSQALPPSERRNAVAYHGLSEEWAQRSADYPAVKRARGALFNAAQDFERQTVSLLSAHLPDAADAFDEHANRVVLRYIGLSVHHAINAALCCLDGVLEPTALLEVPKETAAAIAYRNVALGPARTQELRNRARQHAEWEKRRIVSVGSHDEAAIAVQLFHEYLGVHWKNHADAQRVYLEQFIQWATADAPALPPDSRAAGS